tara:strand:- start:374 stop:562 length:189 start_codon:yes stop_codon:yes gene_type:complete
VKNSTEKSLWKYSFEIPEPLTLDELLKLRKFFRKNLFRDNASDEIPWITSEFINESIEDIKK